MRESFFLDDLELSQGQKKESDQETIAEMLDGCASVRSTTKSQDLQGIDYVATLKNGRDVFIDAKTRAPGASRYWADGPELALERWSVCPSDACPRGRIGWTLDKAKQTELVLYTWDIGDSPLALLLPFQLLRMTFLRNGAYWKDNFKMARQKTFGNGNHSWESESMFVPWAVVRQAMLSSMESTPCW